MKVLVIVGSSRGKGNTYKITKQLEEKIKKLGDVEFSYLFLKETNLEQCRGCFTCVTRGEHLCPIKDDRAKIEEQMLNSDGVIFASPVYVYNITALMKNFIDRFGYASHRPLFFNQSAIAVTTSSGGGIKETLNYLESITRSWGFNFVHKLGVITHPYLIHTPRYSKEIENNMDTAARIFYNSLKTKEHKSPGLGYIIQFRMMRIHAIDTKEYFKADYKYYKEKGLLDRSKKYFIDSEINIFKNIFAGMMEKLILRAMSKSLSKKV
jgi:multimeric flavodoxin WrbA